MLIVYVRGSPGYLSGTVLRIQGQPVIQGLQGFRGLPDGTAAELPGRHMYKPLEGPVEVADIIKAGL